MIRRRNVFLTVMVLLVLFCGLVRAQSVEVVNHSFELDDNGDPNTTKRRMDGTDGLGGVLGWMIGAGDSGHPGVQPDSSKPWDPSNDGEMHAFAMAGDWFYQILSRVINVGDGYTLIYDGLAASSEVDIRAAFVYEDGNDIIEIYGVTEYMRDHHVWIKDLTLGFTAQAGAPYIGKNLGIKFSIVGPGDWNWGIIDYVRIEPVYNQAPDVDAGADKEIDLPADTVPLDGSVSDDGNPDPPGTVTTLWEKVSGPGAVVFGDANAIDTTATFSESGFYVLRLTADDSVLSNSDEMKVVVYMPGGFVTNQSSYPNGQIPLYAKFEATLRVDTNAVNWQLPYDASPPAGLDPGAGISVDILFSPDNWGTTYTQPAFYYEEFEHSTKSGRDWIYPTGAGSWKVRFAPTQTGTWQYKRVVTDVDGSRESAVNSFVVCDSDRKGFLRVSDRDERYFEFDNGGFFPGLGYNLTYNQLSWDNPVVTNTSRFEGFEENGLRLFRTWLSHWGIFTSGWSPWQSPLHSYHGTDPPNVSLSVDYAYPGSDFSMVLYWDWNPGMFLGFGTLSPAVKRDTTYHISIRYFIPTELDGPRIGGNPYGLVAKTGGWLSGGNSDDVYGYCDPGTGTIVSDYAYSVTGDWSILEGSLTTGSSNFLPYFYVVLENITNVAGYRAYIDRVEIREDLGGGNYGPDILNKPWMAHHYYMDQKKSYAFDKVLELAQEHDVYFKLVLLEKNEWIFTHIDFGGNPVSSQSGNYFYGNWRDMTKVRWLQQAWWRYCQGRWGYSANIHSWELLNEGDPDNSRHYALADELGKYMNQFVPNNHLVTTSCWTTKASTFTGFWSNPSYPYVDYADIHKYADQTSHLYWDDLAANTEYYSGRYGANGPDGAGKPLIRGETGFNDGVAGDSSGVWLHNYIWGMINPGGMYEQYWYVQEHILSGGDKRYHYLGFRHFIEDVPLNNGNYQDIEAIVSNPDLRAWGQKDLVYGNAHIWVQNKDHTWNQALPGPDSGTVEIDGFKPNGVYTLQQWGPYETDKSQQVVSSGAVTASAGGRITIQITDLQTDTAFKIVTAVGDINKDGEVDSGDLEILADQWLQVPGTPTADIAPALYGDGSVDFKDFAELANQ